MNQALTNRVVCLLEQYLDDKPDHYNGVCHWLCNKLEDEGYWDAVTYSYDLISFVRENLLKEYGTTVHITEESGYNETRARFVADMLNVLDENNIQLVDGEWCAAPEMTKEEELAHILVHYVNARPDHRFGLCHWLWTEAAKIDYNVVEVYRLRNHHPSSPIYPPLYVDETYGPTEKRVQFARDLLAALENGRLYVGKNGWVYR